MDESQKTFGELVRQEHEKRERNWDAMLRWQVLQQTITWIDSQQAVPRNSKEGCLANQKRLLEQIEKCRASATINAGSDP